VLAIACDLHAEASPSCGTNNLVQGRLPAQSEEVVGDVALVTDGRVAPEGAQWDDPSAVILQRTTAFLTYDLGEPTVVSALYLLADANDVYEIRGSSGDPDGGYRLLGLAASVVEQAGHGLRSRTVHVAPGEPVRFLRVSAVSGDDAYSIGELAAYCQAPSLFPPPFKLTDAAASALPNHGLSALDAEPAPRGQSALVTLAILLGLAGAGISRTKLRSKPATPEARTSERAQRTERMLLLLFLLSGCAALIYEVVWLHLLRLVIGASSLSVGLVLASFMGGMFLGSLLFSRWVSAAHHPLRVYACLELGIGVFGLVMPLLLPLVRSLYLGLVGYGPGGIALRALVAAILLLPPTALMGATLPAVARRYSHAQSGMASLASLYSANTIGAVLGCLLSAFYLLAVWDVWVATYSAVVLNVAVCLLSVRLSRTAPPRTEADVESRAGADERLPEASSVEPGAIYFAAAASGFTALGAQVVWTRLLTLLFGATVYAFALILAVFLACLGLGSAIAAYLLRRGLNPARGLAFCQAALVPALLLSAVILDKVIPYSLPSLATPTSTLHALHVLRAANVILPAATLWGMSFPFGLAAAGLGRGDTARSSGRLYAANTVGAILGALVVSFWLIPAFGTQLAQQVLVVAAGVSAAALFWSLSRAGQGRRRGSRRGLSLGAWALASAALCAAFLPGLSRVFLAHGRYAADATPFDRYLYVSEGASSTVAVHVAPDGTRHFHVSGRVEASNNPGDLRLERLLGHLSALANPRPESVLVVGLGAGITAGVFSLYPEVKRIVICEIEPRVAGAAAQFARENYNVLKDPRVLLVFDDARHFLATTRERFDIITSDPIHPWVRGNSILFSREYYRIVRSRLKPGGIATQWVPLYETSELAIQIQMRTFTDAFPNGTVWNSALSGRGYDVVLLGSVLPVRLDVQAIAARIAGSPAVDRSLREAKITSVVDLLGTYASNGQDMQHWLTGVPVNNDFSLKLEYISGLALNDRAADPIFSHMIEGRQYPKELFLAPEAVHAELRRRLR
jgi:spermidine synthase